MKAFKQFITEKIFTIKDLQKALKKDKSSNPTILVTIRGRGEQIAVDQFTFDNMSSDGTLFGTDRDGNEREFNLKDIDRIN